MRHQLAAVQYTAANIHFTEDSFSQRDISSPGLTLKRTCSKVIEDGAIGQNTYDFLLVVYTDNRT